MNSSRKHFSLCCYIVTDEIHFKMLKFGLSSVLLISSCGTSIHIEKDGKCPEEGSDFLYMARYVIEQSYFTQVN